MATKIIGLVLLLHLSASVYSAELLFTGPDSVGVDTSFDLQIHGDFTGEGLIAGGITLIWDDAQVQLDNIHLELPVIPDFSCPPISHASNCPPNGPNSAPIVWGEFLADLISPTDPAPTLMATLSFTAIGGTGEIALFSMIDNPALTGGWFGTGFNPIPTPAFGTKTVEIGISLDTDNDTVADFEDNCLLKPNPRQRDTDGDGIGNLCDPDIALPNDCLVNFADLQQLELNFFSQGDLDSDLNGDGWTNMGDVGVMKQFFLSAPGPSGLPNNCE